ncbi:MAG TPA: Fe-S cluster assembly protein SufD [Verrucomicrobiae bacterium]|nr:Fe-S cluster assembly protein SufD [Verrucomicrobiae bacterium]
MPNALAEGDALLSSGQRERALARYTATPAGRERPGRYWKVDLESVAPDPAACEPGLGSVRIERVPARVIACDLETAAREHRALLDRVFGVTAAGTTKFGALATAFAGLGAFVYIPADAACDEPVLVSYDVPAGATVFPYTLVLAERGARASVVERLSGGDDAFVCAVAEVVAGEASSVTYAALQSLAPGARVLVTRAANPQRDASVAWASAELGAALCAETLDVALEAPGSQAQLTSLFFPTGTQHVDVVSTVDHRVGETRSETIVKSAATDGGQARYLGNIRIARHAQGSDASLRDDALLLSPKAHIDSIPALEIAANDVKAYHGATVGALDAQHIFYMESRGIDRMAAERMIALGFFEPAIERFPTEELRGQIRTALAEKLS